jgi:hypothetical protein
LLGSTDRRIVVQASLGIIKWDPISKITSTKKAGRVSDSREGAPA